MGGVKREPTLGGAVAEALGTFVLVLVGAGTICVGASGPGANIGMVGVAIASGFALAAMLYALRGYAFAHLNPAATVGALIVRRLTPNGAFKCLLAQLVGAALAGIALRALFPNALAQLHLGAPVMAQGLSFARGVAAEAIVAFAWVLILGVTEWRGRATEVGPIAVGLVYATAILVLGPVTGAAGNPARAFGPAFAAGAYANQAVYWIGPLIGGATAAVIIWITFQRRPSAGVDLDAAAETETAPVERLARTPSEAPLGVPFEAQDDARSAYRRGLLLFREGQLEAAAQYLALATEMRPEWPEPYYYIGMVYREFGDELNANAFFDAALYFRDAIYERSGPGRNRRY